MGGRHLVFGRPDGCGVFDFSLSEISLLWYLNRFVQPRIKKHTHEGGYLLLSWRQHRSGQIPERNQARDSCAKTACVERLTAQITDTETRRKTMENRFTRQKDLRAVCCLTQIHTWFSCHDSLVQTSLVRMHRKCWRRLNVCQLWMLIFQELSLYLCEIYVSILWENSSSTVY